MIRFCIALIVCASIVSEVSAAGLFGRLSSNCSSGCSSSCGTSGCSTGNQATPINFQPSSDLQVSPLATTPARPAVTSNPVLASTMAHGIKWDLSRERLARKNLQQSTSGRYVAGTFRHVSPPSAEPLPARQVRPVIVASLAQLPIAAGE